MDESLDRTNMLLDNRGLDSKLRRAIKKGEEYAVKLVKMFTK